ncbi:Uncharacterized protein dnl_27370 [Desulfonema limicola]|uniref:CysZ protein n=1 Tax=Desulfonema limicola TaxID=45656 RepID=A0A975B7U6_9BACT|nr:EI24 domain-containing protein [Desulfonema limicola]QTA80433.1 Uncharacterized protein dnl_27370 [Desulfonema limicola]
MFIQELIKGLGSYFKAHQVIFKYKLWPYMIIPGIMSLCYIFTLIILGNIWFSHISDYINMNWIPGFLQGEVMQTITTFLLWVLLFLTGYISYQPFILILFSPVLGYLSEITENHIYKQESPPFNFKNLLKDILRSLIINIRNIIKMIFFIAAAWIFIIIPIIGTIISSFLILMIQSFYNGFSLTDYTLERKRFTVKESIAFIKNNRAMTTGIGLGFMLMMFVPVFGWAAAPAYGTVASTIAALEKINNKHLSDMQL